MSGKICGAISLDSRAIGVRGGIEVTGGERLARNLSRLLTALAGGGKRRGMRGFV